jgi:hypothetical protein
MERQQKILALKELLMELEGQTKASSVQLMILFNLHNYFNPKNPQYGKHCGSCVAKVYKKAKAIFAEVKHEIGE